MEKPATGVRGGGVAFTDYLLGISKFCTKKLLGFKHFLFGNNIRDHCENGISLKCELFFDQTFFYVPEFKKKLSV
jgi:hypothetical protein